MDDIDETVFEELTNDWGGDQFSEDEINDSKNSEELTQITHSNVEQVEREPGEGHLEVLRRCFGHQSFRPLQWKIIHSIIEMKRDNCAVMTTGYGKSLCFQYPSAYLGGITIIVSPLISLMEDQVLALKTNNIPACLLGSAQSKQKQVIEDILDDKYMLVYLTPEFCVTDHGIDLLKQIHDTLCITLVAIDEAHCVSSWGHDFRFKYRELGVFKKIMPTVPVIAVTATATPRVRADIIKTLGLKNPQVVCSGFDRPNLYLEVHLRGTEGILEDMKKVTKSKVNGFKFEGSTIIYCITRKQTEQVAEFLQANGVQCLPYHAGLSLKLRKEAHEQFIKDKINVISATIAFGMGIDKPDVRSIIHYGASNSLESYYQEIGRAGRDGRPSTCYAFYTMGDFDIHRKFREEGRGSQAVKDHKEKMANLMLSYLQTRECRRKMVLSYFEGKDNLKMDVNENCCDNCNWSEKVQDIYKGLNSDGKYDFTHDAQILLSCIEAMGGRFGINVYMLFIRGSNSAKLMDKYKTHKLHGCGKDKSESWWKALAVVLETQKYTKKTVMKNKYYTSFTISLSDKGEQFLKDIRNNPTGVKCLAVPPPEILPLLMKLKPVRTSSQPASSQDPATKDVNEELYNLLLKKRGELAVKFDCIPYTVASSLAVTEMARLKPLSLGELRKCSLSGFTETKIANFGQEFVNVIRQHCDVKSDEGLRQKESIRDILIQNPIEGSGINCSASTSYSYFKNGLTIREIAEKRGSVESTILYHLITAMKVGYPVKLIELGVTEEIKLSIFNVIKSLKLESPSLLEIKSKCPPEISYDHIKAVVTYKTIREHLEKLRLPYEDFEDFTFKECLLEISVASEKKENEPSKLSELLEICKTLEADGAEELNSSDSTFVDDLEPPMKKSKDEFDLLDSPPRQSQSSQDTIIVENQIESTNDEQIIPKEPVTRNIVIRKKKNSLPSWFVPKRL